MPGAHRPTIIVLTLATCLFSSALPAADTATQRITIEVKPIDEIALTGERPTLTIGTATAGEAPAAVTADGGAYAITTNGSDRKITASIAKALPPGVTLSVAMDAPAGGTSLGWQALSAAPAELVTGITRIAQSGIPVRYRLAATLDAGILSVKTETVTLTIADGS